MTMTIQNICRALLALLAALTLLLLLAAPALAADGADTVEIGEDGTVTILSGRLAGEMVSSVQVSIRISPAEGATVGFDFDAGMAGRLTNASYRDGTLNIYAAGTAPLAAVGQSAVVLGVITGGDLAGAELPEDALRYVYGVRVIAQSADAQVLWNGPEAEPGDGPALPESQARAALREALEQARAIGPDGYTQSSYAELQTAIEEAEAVLARSDAADGDLNAAAAALQRALDRLVPVAEADGSGPVIGDGADDGTGSGAPEPSETQDGGSTALPEVTDGGSTVSPEATAALAPTATPAPTDDAGPSISPDFTGQSEATATPAPTPTAAPTPTSAVEQAGAPNTGDDSPILACALVLCLSGALLAAICRRRSRSGL